MTELTQRFSRKPSVSFRGAVPETKFLQPRKAFSLVELLVVLSIISIATLWTLSSFGVLKSTSLSSSGNQMVDVFTMARQNSLSKNVYTAIVIKTSGVDACRAFCLLELARNDDGTFGGWTTIMPWKRLGPGVIFETGTANDSFMAQANLQTPPFPAMPSSFPFQGTTFNGATAFQIYQQDGTLMGGQPLRLRLVQGVADAVNVPATTTVQGTDYFGLVLVANTGAVKIERP